MFRERNVISANEDFITCKKTTKKAVLNAFAWDSIQLVDPEIILENR